MTFIARPGTNTENPQTPGKQEPQLFDFLVQAADNSLLTLAREAVIVINLKVSERRNKWGRSKIRNCFHSTKRLALVLARKWLAFPYMN